MSQPKRGRPPEVDRQHVADVALRLFDRKGFDAVTMAQVAKAASVSRRTLFRLFPSKGDLVWEGLAEVLRAVRPHLKTRRTGRRSLAALGQEVFAVPLRGLDEPAAGDLARRRLRLIAASPGLLSHPTLDELRAVLTELVAASSGPRDAAPDLVASAIVGVAFAALLWWATQDEGVSAREALSTALASLSRLEAEHW
ncbi:MAG: TetR family transcriptional regulator [Archangium sp.]|nr:TetR family transcriptional regulator [Archangium sp.]